MKVIKKVEEKFITIEDLEYELRNARGILMWKFSGELHFIKHSFRDKSFSWVSLYFNKGMDNSNLTGIETIRDLIDLIKEEDGEFYWFETEKDFIEWIKSEK